MQVKNITKQPKREPKNLLEHHNARSLNDNFISRIYKQGKSIIKILDDKNSPEELKAAVFIIEINKFNDDFSEIILLVDKYYATINNIESRKKQAEGLLKIIDSKELISKTRKFYWDAWNYDENFNKLSLNLWWNSGSSFFHNTLFFDINLSYSEKKSNNDNIYDAHLFFETHDNYFKNFINVLYGDGEQGENFVQNKFDTIIKEYKYIKEINNNIKKQLTIDTSKEDKIKNDCTEKIEAIMEKYPATIYKAIIDLLNFSEKSKNIHTPPRACVE